MPKQTAIRVTEWRSGDLDGAPIAQISTPEPGEGEALVRMLLRPVNPTDLISLHEAQAATIKLPAIMGREGILTTIFLCFQLKCGQPLYPARDV